MDQCIIDRIVLANDVMMHKDNLEESKLMTDFKDMATSLKMIEDENLPYILGLTDMADLLLLFKKFSNDLKPYYIKYLMVKEANSKEK